MIRRRSWNYMFVVRNSYGKEICARCGKVSFLSKDHFIPKSCRMMVNEEGNYVRLCRECNKLKADHIVLPDWYLFLGEVQKERLNRYMKYARSWIRSNCTDKDILDYIELL